MNINAMMKQAQAMQKKLLEEQEKIAAKEYTGNSGGGVVTLDINGKGDLIKIKIAKDLMVPDEVEILEDLIIAAFNDAKKKKDEDTESSMSGLMGGLNLPGGMKFPF